MEIIQNIHFGPVLSHRPLGLTRTQTWTKSASRPHLLRPKCAKDGPLAPSGRLPLNPPRRGGVYMGLWVLPPFARPLANTCTCTQISRTIWQGSSGEVPRAGFCRIWGKSDFDPILSRPLEVQQLSYGGSCCAFCFLEVETAPSVYRCLLYTSPSPRDYAASRMPSSA